MKYSNMASRTRKSRSVDEMILPSQRILYQSNQLIRYGKGIYGENTILLRARKNIESIIRNTLNDYGCAEVELPVIQPKELWVRSNRYQKYTDSGTMMKSETNQGTFCLAPTAEEAMLAFVEGIVETYKDLPITLYQIGTKFRNEIRFQGGLMRSKEFLMMDAYSFSATHENMVIQYQNMREAYLEIFKKLELDVVPVKALSGDMGGKYSEEFMCITDHGEDVILYNAELDIAFNKELLEIDNAEEFLRMNYGITAELNSFVEKRATELGHIFQLGTNYSESMKITFVNSDGKAAPFYMGCYGIGVGRVLGCICEKYHDNDGIIWPKEIAPFQAHIVYTEQHKEIAFNLYNYLTKTCKFDVLIDDRNGVSFGAKLKDWKLLGTPICFIVGKNTDKDTSVFECEERDTGKKMTVS